MGDLRRFFDDRSALIDRLNAGAKREELIDELEARRIAGKDESEYDHIGDLLDLLVGWCRPDLSLADYP